MVEDRIRNIEAHVRASPGLPEPARAELLELLDALRAELQGVDRAHLDRAEGSVKWSASPTAEVAHGETIDDALGALTGTMTALEATHPALAALANRLAVALSNMGI